MATYRKFNGENFVLNFFRSNKAQAEGVAKVLREKHKVKVRIIKTYGGYDIFTRGKLPRHFRDLP